MSPLAFLRRDGDVFVPKKAAVGPWGPDTVSGLVVSGLIGYAAERAAGDADYIGTRLTVDMIRMAAMGALTTTARILREGRRLRLVDVTIEQNGKSVALGRAVFARRSVHPVGQVWSDPVAAPPPPTDRSSYGPQAYSGEDPNPQPDFNLWRDPSLRKFVWFDLDGELVEGEAMTDFVRAAAIADVANPLTNWGSEGLQFVNSDVTLTLSRLPSGPAIGMAARDRHDHDGISVGTTTMYDVHGPVGSCVVSALASEVPMQPPPPGRT